MAETSSFPTLRSVGGGHGVVKVLVGDLASEHVGRRVWFVVDENDSVDQSRWRWAWGELRFVAHDGWFTELRVVVGDRLVGSRISSYDVDVLVELGDTDGLEAA